MIQLKRTSTYTYGTIEITTSYQSYTRNQIYELYKNPEFQRDVDEQIVLLTDGVREFNCDNTWVKISWFLEDKDPSGRPMFRVSQSSDGFNFHLISIEITTAKYGGIYNKDHNEVDLGLCTHKIYDSSGTEITSAASEANSVRTEVLFVPNYDLEAMGGVFSQNAAPAQDIRMWALGAPGIADVKYATGGINLKYSGNQPFNLIDARASKLMKYVSAMPLLTANKIVLRHPAGAQHTFQLHLVNYKPL